MTRGLLDELEGRLRSRAASAVAEWEARPAAVLVPLFSRDGEWNVLFTRRTDEVEEHRGQVSFPGGLIEPGDLDAQRAALREAEEEIGLRPQDVRVLGTLDPLYTVTQFHVTPVVAAFPWPYRLRQNPREVASVFGVPLTWLRQPGNLDVRPRQLPPPGKTVSVFYFRPYEGHVIWGATARIVVQLLQELAALPGGGKDERGG